MTMHDEPLAVFLRENDPAQTDALWLAAFQGRLASVLAQTPQDVPARRPLLPFAAMRQRAAPVLFFFAALLLGLFLGQTAGQQGTATERTAAQAQTTALALAVGPWQDFIVEEGGE